MTQSRKVTLYQVFPSDTETGSQLRVATCVNGAQTVSVFPVSPGELVLQRYLSRTGNRATELLDAPLISIKPC